MIYFLLIEKQVIACALSHAEVKIGSDAPMQGQADEQHALMNRGLAVRDFHLPKEQVLDQSVGVHENGCSRLQNLIRQSRHRILLIVRKTMAQSAASKPAFDHTHFAMAAFLAVSMMCEWHERLLTPDQKHAPEFSSWAPSSDARCPVAVAR